MMSDPYSYVRASVSGILVPPDMPRSDVAGDTLAWLAVAVKVYLKDNVKHECV